MTSLTFASLARRGGWWLAALAASAWCGLAAELFVPTVAGRAVDGVLRGGPGGQARWLLAAVALVIVVLILEAFGELAAGYSDAQATAWLRHRLVGGVLARGAGLARRAGAAAAAVGDPADAAAAGDPADGGDDDGDGDGDGDMVSRIVGNATEAGQAGVALVSLTTAVLLPAGSLVGLVLIDPWLGVAFAVGALVVAVLLRSFVRRTTDSVAAYQQTQGAIATRLTQAIAGARTIAAADTVNREAIRILEPLSLLRRHGTETWNLLAGAAARGTLAGPLLVVSVVATGGSALQQGRISPGELLAATQYASLGAGIGGAVAALGQVARARAGTRRAAEALAAPATRYGSRALPAGPGRLEFRGVTVRAGDTALLAGIDLAVPGGAAIAVVGRSGSGKSVLAALAGRLADPDEGDVRLDGVALRDLPRATLRGEIAVAFERPVLVGETIADAVSLGDHRPTTAGMRAAVRAARADRFVERLPRGYRTALADAPMSGGERQRLGLARAWRGRRLLVLDDATSSLDTATEMEIARALTGDAGRRTRLVVAHRASTAASADLVAWLDGGRLRAVAPHARLWLDPDYRAVFQTEPTG
jgi:ATP-binding cassette subfamily B protein